MIAGMTSEMPEVVARVEDATLAEMQHVDIDGVYLDRLMTATG